MQNYFPAGFFVVYLISHAGSCTTFYEEWYIDSLHNEMKRIQKKKYCLYFFSLNSLFQHLLSIMIILQNLEKCNHTVELHIVCKENSCTKTNNYYELLVKESVCNILQFVPTWLIVCTCPRFCKRTNTLVDHIIVFTIKIYMLVSKMSTVLSICKLWQNYKSRKKTVYHYSRLWLTLTGLNFIHFTTITNQVIQLILIMLFGTNVCVRL